MKDEFLLDPSVTYLNHGSFGACPRPVFERYQGWQRELEREPVDFIHRRLPGLLAESRAALAAYVGCAPDDLTFVPNATTGVNLAARSLELRPGDEVLATDLEYGACDLAWEWVCERARARYVRAETPLPIARPEDVVEAALGADFYAGNCHKWLCGPKGAGFLHVRPEHQDRVGGAIVSWGYREPSTFLSRTERQGTRDAAAYLAVPDAIEFQRERNWDDVRARCAALAREAREDLCAVVGTEAIAPAEMLLQMASVRLPGPDAGLEQRLFDEDRIEVLVMAPACDLLRISVAAYTERADVDRLLEVMVK